MFTNESTQIEDSRGVHCWALYLECEVVSNRGMGKILMKCFTNCIRHQVLLRL